MSSAETVVGKIGDRFEIRRLTEDHLEWVSALSILSNNFYSPLWTKIYPAADRTALTYSISSTLAPLGHIVVKSGMCLGVFDTQYKFKRAESEATGGKLYWDRTDKSKSREELEDEMDFPLVHVAMSFNLSNPPPEAVMKQVFEAMPLWGWFEEEFEKKGKEGGSQNEPGQESMKPEKVLKRCGTSTRGGYMNQGIMRACSDFLMKFAKDNGYEIIDIDAAHQSVTKVWMNPPPPFRAKFIATLDPKAYADAQGVMEQQFTKSDTSLDRIRVYL